MTTTPSTPSGPTFPAGSRVRATVMIGFGDPEDPDLVLQAGEEGTVSSQLHLDLCSVDRDLLVDWDMGITGSVASHLVTLIGSDR